MSLSQAKLTKSEGGTPTELIDAVFLQEVRCQMLKFANQQLQDPHLAEDAVQEALEGALKSSASFSRRAALKTWIFSILKNKIVDIFRQKKSQPDLLDIDKHDDCLSHQKFDQRGHWQASERPAAWTQPDNAVYSEQFWQIFELCLTNLPEHQSRVFMMREFLELDTQEICDTLDIAISNLHVLLYRARLSLRECLELKWFMEKKL